MEAWIRRSDSDAWQGIFDRRHPQRFNSYGFHLFLMSDSRLRFGVGRGGGLDTAAPRSLPSVVPRICDLDHNKRGPEDALEYYVAVHPRRAGCCYEIRRALPRALAVDRAERPLDDPARSSVAHRADILVPVSRRNPRC